ncbi:MAG: hypothetical protein RL318_1823 [Fibrobacterota bacterium]|jgi:hypothetical protein
MTKRAPKKLPYAVANFEKVIEEGYRFVDKTEYIRSLEEFEVPVFLRPRRFGKTLWCSTLECYYDILRKEKFEALFGELAIGKNPTGLQNSFMVLRLNFSLVQVSADMSVLERNFTNLCNRALEAFAVHYAAFLGAVSIEEHLPVSENLDRLLLAQKSRKDCPALYLIIDEYDNFSNQYVTTGQDALYQDLTTGDSFFRTFFKVVKAGCESRAIGKVFITGVLPITMDDLTSGFNIAEIVTLKPSLHGMLGFTQDEVDAYLTAVACDYDLPTEDLEQTRQLVKNWYNGYRFLPNAKETLYNATILTYFLKNWALDREYPQDMIDPNVKTDVRWIERLGFGEGTSLALIQDLLRGEGMPFDANSLSDKFNATRFFETDHYAASLFFLGMLTVKDEDRLDFPNQTLATIFAQYHNQLARVEVSKGYTEWFKAFRSDLDLGKLFDGYWKTYMGQIPAQAFDKVNENFIRTTFFEVCTRYLSRHFSFGIEVNYPSGRCDFEMTGRPEGAYRNRKWIVEFKYHTKSSGVDLEKIVAPDPVDVAQVEGYKRDALAQFPELSIRTAVCVVVGNVGFRWFDLGTRGR